MYSIDIIENIEQLEVCPTFYINNYQWTKNYRPYAFGQMALLKDYGIVISMTAMEKNPLRRYVMNEDPVYLDSGLEAFINFNPDYGKEYLNFEMNANGALLSQYGKDRNRTKLSQLTSYRALCTAKIEAEAWSILLKIPMELICDVYKIKPLKKGDMVSCNFYKISEDPSIEHYASYSPIDYPTPNFHLPEFFGKAVIN